LKTSKTSFDTDLVQSYEVDDTKTCFGVDHQSPSILVTLIHFRLPRLNMQYHKETFIAILSEHMLNFVFARTMSKLFEMKHFIDKTRVIQVHYIIYYILFIL